MKTQLLCTKHKSFFYNVDEHIADISQNVTYLFLVVFRTCMHTNGNTHVESYTEDYGVEPLQSLEMETSTTSQATINTNTLYTVMGSAFSMQNICIMGAQKLPYGVLVQTTLLISMLCCSIWYLFSDPPPCNLHEYCK